MMSVSNKEVGTFAQKKYDEIRALKIKLKDAKKENAALKESNKVLVELFYSVYSGINILMGVLGADGEISTRDSVSSDMMDILYDFDGGRFIQDKEQFLKALDRYAIASEQEIK